VGVVLYFNLENIFIETFTSYELSQAQIMFSILLINLVISLPGNAFNAIIIAYEEFVFNRGFTLFKLVLRILLLVLLLKLGYNAIAIVILDTVINIVTILVNIYFCKVYLKIEIKLAVFEKKLVFEVFGYSIFIFLNMIFDQLIWRAPSIIIGIKMSTIAVAVFTVGMQFSSLFMNFSTAISAAFLPRITSMVISRESNIALTNFMIKVGRIQAIILIYIYISFVILGRQFIFLWVGDGYKEAWSTALIIMTGLILPLMENSGLSILQAMKKHQFYVIVYLIICVFNIITTIYIIKYTGVIGVAIMTMLGLFLGHGVIINWYYHYKIGLDMRRFFKELVKGIFPTSMIIGIITYFIIDYMQINSWAMFIYACIVITLIYFMGMWIFGANQYERNLVVGPIKDIYKNIRRENLK
jgi:O-antigen/teichoic acid export membrane protein